METKTKKQAVKPDKQQKASVNNKKPYRDLAGIFKGKIIYNPNEDIFNLAL
ncbi:hypothetical protein AGMMS50239_02010 [Bacteroidia bacterium]|nr:hypothetical protein AGMMS50239_02010 [Bacteroidia bacterium]